MTPRPPGSLVRICPYDFASDGPEPRAGDYLRTVGLRGGTIYEIVEIRRVEHRTQLRRPYKVRFAIVARKLGRDVKLNDSRAKVFSMAWHPRKRRDRR